MSENPRELTSMTGFARHVVNLPTGEFVCELKTVNQRYLDFNFRLPEVLRGYEMQIRQFLGKHIKRGRVDCFMQFVPNVAQASFETNIKHAENILRAYQDIHDLAARANMPLQSLDALAVLNQPGVMQSAGVDESALEKDLMTVLEKTCEDLCSTRLQEGEKMAQFFKTRLTNLQDHTKAIEVLYPDFIEKQTERLQAVFENYKTETDETRLHQELVLVAQKADIAEEISRLYAHFDAFAAALDQSEPVGRRLEFLLQEIHREINTIGSKSQLKDISNHIVDCKVIGEQIREQVQNVE